MSDLIERLRKTAAARAKATAHDDPNNYLLVVARLSREDADLMAEAAAEIARLREALEPFAEAAEECDEYGFDDSNQAPVDAGQCREARAALSSPHAAKGEAG